MNDSKAPVTVIGLGPMGQAMVGVLLEHGHPMTVWNRTPSRADGVVAKGAVLAPTAAAAVAASELVILSLTDYQAMYDVLGSARTELTGRVIVNLSSDTPEKTREATDWAAARDAGFLAGGVMVPEPLVGKEGAYVFYSGPKAVFDAHEATLRLIGRPEYVGEDVRLAQLYYQAHLDIFLTSLSAFLHATALLGSAGVAARDFAPWAAAICDSVSSYLPDAAAAIDRGVHPGELATVTMMGATAAHILETSQVAGIDLVLPSAVKFHYDRAISAGHGQDSWTRLIDSIRKPSTS